MFIQIANIFNSDGSIQSDFYNDRPYNSINLAGTVYLIKIKFKLNYIKEGNFESNQYLYSYYVDQSITKNLCYGKNPSDFSYQKLFSSLIDLKSLLLVIPYCQNFLLGLFYPWIKGFE